MIDFFLMLLDNKTICNLNYTKEEILVYLFGKITITPQLPDRISELSNLANNLWWSWNSYALRLYDYIDSNLFIKVDKNPVKFLSEINQQRLIEVSNDPEFLKEYDMVIENFKG